MSSVPPQPINQGPSRNVLLAGGLVIALIVLTVLVLLLNLTGKPSATLAPSILPGSSVAPTLAGSPHPSSVLSTPGASTTESTALPTPVGPPPSGYDAFLVHVPEALRSSCTPVTNPDDSVIFSASCTTSEGIGLNYQQYADADSMNAAFDNLFAQAQIDPNSGSCEDPNTWPAEGTYQVEGSDAGRRYCTNQAGTPTIYWTDERLNFLSTATGSDAAGLVTFWTNEAGPIE